MQVEVQSKRPITFEGTVHAFALNEQQKNELTVGLGEGSRLPRSVSDSLLASAQGQPKPGIHPFKGTCSVPVSIAFEPVRPQPLLGLQHVTGFSDAAADLHVHCHSALAAATVTFLLLLRALYSLHGNVQAPPSIASCSCCMHACVF